MHFNPFWADVLKGLKELMSKENFFNNENVFDTPIWYDNTQQIRINLVWFDKGITTIWDLMGEDKKILSLSQFNERYNLETNFLEYGSISS